MNVHNIIMKAADLIEGNPEGFDWSSCVVGGCGTPGCALGWICAVAGQEVGRAFRTQDIPGFIDEDHVTFYTRMDGICPSFAWKRSAAECAKTLRTYAHLYHPLAALDPQFVRFRDSLYREFALTSAQHMESRS